MLGVILAGGKGTRLGKLTHNQAKPAVPLPPARITPNISFFIYYDEAQQLHLSPHFVLTLDIKQQKQPNSLSLF